MKKISKTIVFFGSGPVAARSLKLLANSFEIEAVVTKPKPEHHRGSFPVIDLARELGIDILFAADKRQLSEIFRGSPVQSELAVLIDFGVIVDRDVIDYFPLGIVNSHFSLLPEWRGADPITFSILSGQAKTGVSLMLIDEGMDTGLLLTQRSHQIQPGTTTPELTDQLIDLSDQLIREYLPKYIAGDLKPRRQPHPDRATYSRRLTKDDGLIDWQKPAAQIEREIRAFIDWPKSRCELFDREVILTKARIIDEDISGKQPGDVVVRDKQILVQTQAGLLKVERLKPAGKNEMSSEAFLAGHRL